MSITHSLKTWPHEHDAIGDGTKPFEVRSNTDRSFDVGDILLLRRWDPFRTWSHGKGTYISENDTASHNDTGAHTHRMRVTYVLHGGRFGLPPGMCVMGIEPDPEGE